MADKTIHETEEQAREYGKAFVARLGWAYNPGFRVYQDSLGQWVCESSSWDSCD